jgi:hypothetical protein
MVVSVDVRSNIGDVLKRVDAKEKEVHDAARRAINGTVTQVRTEASRQIRQERALPAREVNKSLTVRRANYRDLTARVVAKGRPISLKHYGAKGPRGRPKKQAITRDSRGRFTGGTGSPPVTIEIIRGSRKVVKGGFFGPNDHVFRRTGRGRLPIQVLFGPSIPSGMAKRVVNQAMVRKTRDVFPRLFERELRRIVTA